MNNTIVFFINKKLLFFIKNTCIISILFACGYQLSTNLEQNKEKLIGNAQLKVLVYSYDPFNTITRAIKNQLILNNIIIFNDLCDTQHKCAEENIPSLEIINISKNHVILSIFSNGVESEYQIILKVQAQFFIPKKKQYYPVNISVSRNFIYNSKLALSNLVQEKEILNEMYQNIAYKLVQQFLIQLNN